MGRDCGVECGGGKVALRLTDSCYYIATFILEISVTVMLVWKAAIKMSSYSLDKVFYSLRAPQSGYKIDVAYMNIIFQLV